MEKVVPQKPKSGLTLSPYQLKLDYRGPWNLCYSQIKVLEDKSLFSSVFINLLFVNLLKLPT